MLSSYKLLQIMLITAYGNCKVKSGDFLLIILKTSLIVFITSIYMCTT